MHITIMKEEILEIPRICEQLLSRSAKSISTLANDLSEKDFDYIISLGRGSSGHAASYLQNLCAVLLKKPMVSISPALQSVYQAGLDPRHALCFSISQSGQSPDILQLTQSLVERGAHSVSLTNDRNSPLANAVHSNLEIRAGVENSVAATKTFVASLFLGVWLFAEMAQDKALLNSLYDLPTKLSLAIECDWSELSASFQSGSVYTLGRGTSAAISNEASLKLKETCLIHAESFSAAEFRHGPIALLDEGFPVIIFASRDMAETSLAQLADELAQKGAQVFATTNKVKIAKALPTIRTKHPLTDGLSLIVSFYSFVEAQARYLGINPDLPPHLNKVTKTT